MYLINAALSQADTGQAHSTLLYWQHTNLQMKDVTEVLVAAVKKAQVFRNVTKCKPTFRSSVFPSHSGSSSPLVLPRSTLCSLYVNGTIPVLTPAHANRGNPEVPHFLLPLHLNTHLILDNFSFFCSATTLIESWLSRQYLSISSGTVLVPTTS